MPVDLRLARSQQGCIAFGGSQKTLVLCVFQLETTLVAWLMALSITFKASNVSQILLTQLSVCFPPHAFCSIIKTLVVTMDPYTSSRIPSLSQDEVIGYHSYISNYFLLCIDTRIQHEHFW